MAKIPAKVRERYIKQVSRFQKILTAARKRDVNEADTVSIIQDMLGEVFGFDKYLEVTSEYAIRGTFCDLAIKIDDKIQYLLEVKAIGTELKPAHLKQAVDYAANHGVQWVVLTNGIVWELHRMRYERPIDHDQVSSFSFLEIRARNEEDQQKLFLLSRRGLSGSVREEFYERVQSVNRHVIGALIQSPDCIKLVRRNLRKMVPGLKVEEKEIEAIIHDEVLKRDITESDEASQAIAKVRKFVKKKVKRSAKRTAKKMNTSKQTVVKALPPNSSWSSGSGHD